MNCRHGPHSFTPRASPVLHLVTHVRRCGSPVRPPGWLGRLPHLKDLRYNPRRCMLAGMDTSTTPRISPVLDPEVMAALMLHYALIREDVAYQYARALIRRLSADVGHYEVIQLARDIVTETTNDIRDFEGDEIASRIDVVLRQLIDRVEADEAFMAELAD